MSKEEKQLKNKMKTIKEAVKRATREVDVTFTDHRDSKLMRYVNTGSTRLHTLATEVSLLKFGFKLWILINLDDPDSLKIQLGASDGYGACKKFEYDHSQYPRILKALKTILDELQKLPYAIEILNDAREYDVQVYEYTYENIEEVFLNVVRQD